MKHTILLLIATLISGCTAPSMLVEYDHVSHPLAGWPLHCQCHSEDEVNDLNVALRFRSGDWYADGALGWNLYGKNGAGFWGPALTGTVRVGRELHPFQAVAR